MIPANRTIIARILSANERYHGIMKLTEPSDIQPSTEAFKAWMGEAQIAISDTMTNATKQLEEIGVAMTEVKRLWAELRNEI